jgi:tRNA pseudouridine-54 N-methylase
MISLVKGFDTTVAVDNLEDIGSWKLVGASVNYTLSGSTYTNNELTIPASAIATVPTGDYLLYLVTASTTLVRIDSCTVSDLVYTKSHYRTVLEALQATLENRATKEQSEVQVAGRLVRYLSLNELIQAINQYKQFVAQEDAQNSITSGNSFSGIIRTRWGI